MMIMCPIYLKVKDALAEVEGVRLAVIFGSAVFGQLRPESDIDVALLREQPMSTGQLDAVSGCLALATGRPVDLIDLAHANGPILRTILNDGHVLIETDKQARGHLAVRLLDWQEDFYPYWKRMHEARLETFIAPIHA